MKKYLLTSFFIVLVTTASFSQSTEIKPGLILPQMTTAQRTAWASPTNGTLVFDTGTQSYWYRQSGTWAELPQAGSTSNYWRLNGLGGNEIKNTNSGGFWSANPIGLVSASNDVSNTPTAPVNSNGTRLMWISNRSAFRVGTVSDDYKSWDADSIGLYSFASGKNTKAKGKYSTAMGIASEASGLVSTALGYSNIASGSFSTAMGYETNASGNSSTTMGHVTKASGNFSTAMGSLTSTNNKEGSFVIGDNATTFDDTLYATNINQFSARFENGYRLFTDNNLSFATKYGVVLVNRSNSWGTISDSTKKERFLPYNPQQVLNSVAAMRIGTWNYKGDDRPEGRHWGVMAQDFYHHFGSDNYGTIGSDTLIATADFDGVSFAAIKALEERSSKQLLEIEALKRQSSSQSVEIATLQVRLSEMSALKERVAKLETMKDQSGLVEEKLNRLQLLLEQKVSNGAAVSVKNEN